MTVSEFALPGDALSHASEDAHTPTRRAAWQLYRPIAIAIPLFMSSSYLAWRHDTPENFGHLPLGVWLLLCLAGAVAPVITYSFALRLSERYPLAGSLSWPGSASHAAAIVVSFMADLAVRAIVAPRSPIPVAHYSLAGLLANAAMTYAVLSLGCQGFRTARDAKQAEAARARLRDELIEAGHRRAEAELRALKAELNPHFLGNALQGVKALMRNDVDAAQHVLVSLGDLLRAALTRASTQETPLREEIESVVPFIDVERAHLRGRLELDFDVDESTLDLLVPDMILQPLVENAVKHGLVPFGGGRIRISARRAGSNSDALELTVEDDGVSLGSVGTTRSAKGGGVGLANIRSRLRELYGARAGLELVRGGLGTMVRVTLPARHADSADVLETDASDSNRRLAAETLRISRPTRFIEDSWSGRGWRVAAMAGTIGLWFLWTMNNIAGNVRSILAKGYGEKTAYAIVDGIVVGTMMVMMVHVAFWLSRRLPMAIHGTKSVLGAIRVVAISIAAGVGCAAAICLVKISVAAALRYTEVLDRAHLARNLPGTIVSLETIFLLACVFAQSFYAIKGSHTARGVGRHLHSQLDDTRRRRADAELRALKSELNPHFIGNALNAVSVLMRSDPAAAARLIDQLSDLLRTAVDRASTQEVTLREELESLQPFLAVERIRLGQHLDVRLAVDEQTLNGRVPHMILQPLVENAVKHGFAARDGGHIEVRAHRGAGYLELSISDDGEGLSIVVPAVRRGGTGLTNARARLSKLYGQSASLELTSIPEGGAVARLLIPWHETEAPVLHTRVRTPARAPGPRPVTRRSASAADAAGSP